MFLPRIPQRLKTMVGQVVHPVNRLAKEKRQHRVLKGNQFITSGLEGQRKRKRPDGVEEHETLGPKKIRAEISGAHRTTEILKNAFETNEKANEKANKITKEERDEVRATLFEKFNQFETKIIDMKHEQLQNQSTTSPEYGHDFLDERTNPIFKSEGQC
jgi:hypothetical protein